MAECIEREAAISVIEEKQKELCPDGMYSRHAVYGSDREKFDAWQEIIDTLENIPAADVVSRDAFNRILAENDDMRTMLAQIGKKPGDSMADVRPVVRGKWEEVEVTWLSDIEDQPDAIASMFCPKCKRFANHVYHYGDPTHGMNYCPNCGADMREES